MNGINGLFGEGQLGDSALPVNASLRTSKKNPDTFLSVDANGAIFPGTGWPTSRFNLLGWRLGNVKQKGTLVRESYMVLQAIFQD